MTQSAQPFPMPPKIEITGQAARGLEVLTDGLAAGEASRTAMPGSLNALPRAPLAPLPRVAAVAALDAAALALVAIGARIVAGPGAVHRQNAALCLALLLTVLLAWLRGGYRARALCDAGRQLRAVLPGLAGAWGLTLAAAAAFGALDDIGLGFAVKVAAVQAMAVGLGRCGLAALMSGTAGDQMAPRVVLLGEGPLAARLLRMRSLRARGGLRLLGLLADQPMATQLPCIGDTEAVFGMIRRGEVDAVLLTAPLTEPSMQGLLERLADHPVEVFLAAGPDGAELVPLLGLPIAGWRAVLKRLEDCVLALLALLVAAAPMAMIALAIRLDSAGPALFRQRRTGFNNCDFEILKFRTLYHHAADCDACLQVRHGDTRVTRIGAILRRTSLDELPQLFNVLHGEMSFVGPRPHAPGTRAAGRYFEQIAPRYAARHRLKPGLTGLAQVRGWRGPTETEEKLLRRVESDLEYIETWSIWLDIAIVLRTILAVARMRNAH